ncbi:hypothetical protein [Pontiella sulfatireligans]|uniref:Glycoside hydrolase family 42 N-terminal domain-containing protein n=1 Tax=Pontiella sulfatireligans TaxID=2750658 RepID=A0A6C2UNH5_9BACT|nr:hypothetical protein [Pontiella sulfatireligans]VGO20831.1 hypothetical protein SCARR_02898 [Pontiella sulfatireligans]
MRIFTVIILVFLKEAVCAASDMADSAYFGIASIWTHTNDDVEEFPFVRVLQGVTYWKKLQPVSADQFDWCQFDLDMNRAAELKKPMVIQINGGAPEWIFAEVPWVGGTARNCRAPQFWHPIYMKHYCNLLEKVADRVKSSPHRKWVLGIRVQPNAFNTEAWRWDFHHGEVLKAGSTIDRSQWKILEDGKWVPAGDAIYPPRLEDDDYAVAKQYFAAVVRAYKEAFHPLGIYTFIRPWISFECGLGNEWMDEHVYTSPLMVVMGTEASASHFKYMAPRAQDYKRRCIDRGMIGYYEDVKNTPHQMSTRTRKKFPAGATQNDAQEIYWRQLYKLYLGVTYSATYEQDLERYREPGFSEAFRLFNKYAGMYLYPDKTPGAFVVLCEFDGNKESLRNIGYYITQIDPDAVEIVGHVDADYRGYSAARLTSEKMSFRVDKAFAAETQGETVKINVTWLAERGNEWQLQFRHNKRIKTSEVVSGSSGRWKVQSFIISKADFRSAKVDFVILKKSGEPIFHMIEIERTNPQVVKKFN